jgi:phage-related tail fiber protein
MKSPKRTPAETWRAIEAQAREVEIDQFASMPRANVDARLRAMGEDPDALRAQGAALAKSLGASRDRLAWQAAAAEGLARAQARVAGRTAHDAGVPRDVLVARLTALRASPRFTEQPSLLFRNRKTEEATDDELRAIVEELEVLAEREG